VARVRSSATTRPTASCGGSSLAMDRP
jgi:hypothetical protein